MLRKSLCKRFAIKSTFLCWNSRLQSRISFACGESELSGSAIETRWLKMVIQKRVRRVIYRIPTGTLAITSFSADSWDHRMTADN
jgi:hypothetical protein